MKRAPKSKRFTAANAKAIANAAMIGTHAAALLPALNSGAEGCTVVQFAAEQAADKKKLNGFRRLAKQARKQAAYWEAVDEELLAAVSFELGGSSNPNWSVPTAAQRMPAELHRLANACDEHIRFWRPDPDNKKPLIYPALVSLYLHLRNWWHYNVPERKWAMTFKRAALTRAGDNVGRYILSPGPAVLLLRTAQMIDPMFDEQACETVHEYFRKQPL
jgi:hypothetical protein